MASNFPIFLNGPTMSQREPRTHVMLSARIWRDGWAEPSTHRLVNISTHGACVGQATSLVRDDTITVQIGSMEPVLATVAWSRQGIAGLHFAEPVDVTEARRSRTGHATAVSAGWMTQINDAYRR